MENKKVDPAERKIALIGLSFMALCFSIFIIWLSGCFNFGSQERAKEDANSSISNDSSISNEGGQSEPAKPSSGIYRAEDLEVGAVFQVSISNNTWSESKKLCSYCETTYSSGFIEGNELMYNYGGVSVKVGVISGNAVIMNYSGTQITLEMDGSVN